MFNRVTEINRLVDMCIYFSITQHKFFAVHKESATHIRRVSRYRVWPARVAATYALSTPPVSARVTLPSAPARSGTTRLLAPLSGLLTSFI